METSSQNRKFKGLKMLFIAKTDNKEYEIEVQETALKWQVTLTNKQLDQKEVHQLAKKDFQSLGEFISFIFNHRSYLIDIVTHGDDYTVFTRGSLKTIKLSTEEKLFFKEITNSLVLTTNMDINSSLPGKVTEVAIQLGSSVKPGDLLLVVEAMKMENEIWAPHAGIVKKIYVKKGQSVTTGMPLLSIQPQSS